MAKINSIHRKCSCSGYFVLYSLDYTYILRISNLLRVQVQQHVFNMPIFCSGRTKPRVHQWLEYCNDSSFGILSEVQVQYLCTNLIDDILWMLKQCVKFRKKEEKIYLSWVGFEPGFSCIVPRLPAKCVPIPITNCYWVKGQKRSASPLSCWSTWVQKHCSCSWRRTHRLCRSFFPKKSLIWPFLRI